VLHRWAALIAGCTGLIGVGIGYELAALTLHEKVEPNAPPVASTQEVQLVPPSGPTPQAPAETAAPSTEPSQSEPSPETAAPPPKPSLDRSTADTSPPAEPTDPYANGQRQEATARYVTARKNFLDKVQVLYFAFGCKVFDMEAQFWQLFSNEESSLGDQMTHENITDSTLRELEQKARQSGANMALKPGGCDYWHNNPDAVYSLREEAGIASQMH